MALDGAFLHLLKKEIADTVVGARIEKIAQPSKDEIVISLRFRGGSAKLLLSINANTPRVHFTQFVPENPKSPPMFCMLLRKHLGSGKLIAVNQSECDRIIHLEFETMSELGELTNTTVIVEIMGRHSNLILVNAQGKIIDAMKRIHEDMSSIREVLPSGTYHLPPTQDEKCNPLLCTSKQVIQRIQNSKEEKPLPQLLMQYIQGISPVLAKEIALQCTPLADTHTTQLDTQAYDKLSSALENVFAILKENKGHPTILYDTQGKPKDFSFLPMENYAQQQNMTAIPQKSYSDLLDVFFAQRNAMDRMKQHSGDLLKFLSNTMIRLEKKRKLQQQELIASGERENLRIYGELLTANLHRIKKGDTMVSVQNYYEEALPIIDIPLEPFKTPNQNAQKYFHEYKKADTAEKMLIKLIEQGKTEQIYIESVLDALTRAKTVGELTQIREELIGEGYLKKSITKKGNKKPEKTAYLKYQSTDGFLILVGKNNLQNDKLTLKDTRNWDMWFHTQTIAGAHTVVISENQPIPNTTLEQAAKIAAYNSKAVHSSKIAVDYCVIKNVKKPSGAKPGMVIYDNYTTAIVDQDEMLVNSLLIQ